LSEENNEREDDLKDEIAPEDGLVRYWMFLNGEAFRLFAALASASFGVFWCFLYVLGAGQSILGIILIILTAISFVAWRLLEKQLREYEESRWKKDKHSPRRDRIEIRVVIGLWLFIFISIGIILLQQWRHDH
jgi:hypothetical protein